MLRTSKTSKKNFLNKKSIKLSSNWPKTCSKKNKSYKIGKGRPGGGRDKSKEVRFNRMQFLIHYKLCTVELHYFQSRSTAKLSYK